jgi:hypothetical protein
MSVETWVIIWVMDHSLLAPSLSASSTKTKLWGAEAAKGTSWEHISCSSTLWKEALQVNPLGLLV